MSEEVVKNDIEKLVEEYLELQKEAAKVQQELAVVEAEWKSLNERLAGVQGRLSEYVGRNIPRRVFGTDGQAVIVRWQGCTSPPLIEAVTLE